MTDESPITSIADDELAMLSKHQSLLLYGLLKEGLSYKSLAATHKVPVGTVKSRINRARLAIAKRREAEKQSG